ncbi:YSIRK-type signal peptide-containing protein [Streptococcus uberis]|uniref:YSIRK-type signal peptide-containing protein n=1 Tax=Streptococcus uberis TaxID=1349 RepID=UPI0027DC567A|nr:YSIRK-type signal peptide-containing protein [Streptococcus uberis]MCK1193453.1 YSIRK-type signal peptide-containing protein [Streptococcus uberis]
MKKKQEMKYYLRKSAYGLAAVSVAVLAVGSPVSAQEKAANNEPKTQKSTGGSKKNLKKRMSRKY